MDRSTRHGRRGISIVMGALAVASFRVTFVVETQLTTLPLILGWTLFIAFGVLGLICAEDFREHFRATFLQATRISALCR